MCSIRTRVHAYSKNIVHRKYEAWLTSHCGGSTSSKNPAILLWQSHERAFSHPHSRIIVPEICSNGDSGLLLRHALCRRHKASSCHGRRPGRICDPRSLAEGDERGKGLLDPARLGASLPVGVLLSSDSSHVCDHHLGPLHLRV